MAHAIFQGAFERDFRRWRKLVGDRKLIEIRCL